MIRLNIFKVSRNICVCTLQVILGGGRNRFLPASAGGKRNDNRNLIEVYHLEHNLPYDNIAISK